MLRVTHPTHEKLLDTSLETSTLCLHSSLWTLEFHNVQEYHAYP